MSTLRKGDSIMPARRPPELEREDRVNSKDIMQQLDKQSKDIAEMTGMVEMLFKMVKELHARR